MTPHMLLGMVEDAHAKISVLEERVGYLQRQHDDFSNHIMSSVDQQTVAVRAHFKNELDRQVCDAQTEHMFACMLPSDT